MASGDPVIIVWRLIGTLSLVFALFCALMLVRVLYGLGSEYAAAHPVLAVLVCLMGVCWNGVYAWRYLTRMPERAP